MFCKTKPDPIETTVEYVVQFSGVGKPRMCRCVSVEWETGAKMFYEQCLKEGRKATVWKRETVVTMTPHKV